MLLNQSFEEKLKRKLSYKFKRLEKQRKKERNKWIFFKFLAVLTAVFISFLLIKMQLILVGSHLSIFVSFTFIFQSGFLIFGAISYVNKKRKKSKFYISFKEEIINCAFKVAGLNVSYKKNNLFSEEEFLESRLYEQFFTKFYSDDVVVSNSFVKSYKLGEVHAIVKQGARKSSGELTIFKGLFMKSKVDNSNEGYFVCRQKSNGFGLKELSTALHDVFGFNNNKKKDKLKLFSIEDRLPFLNNYDVFCNNPAIIDNFINEEFLIRLKSYLNKQSNINFSIIDDQIFIAFPQSKNLLEININKSITEQYNLEKEIINYISIVDFLTVFQKEKT